MRGIITRTDGRYLIIVKPEATKFSYRELKNELEKQINERNI